MLRQFQPMFLYNYQRSLELIKIGLAEANMHYQNNWCEFYFDCPDSKQQALITKALTHCIEVFTTVNSNDDLISKNVLKVEFEGIEPECFQEVEKTEFQLVVRAEKLK